MTGILNSQDSLRISFSAVEIRVEGVQLGGGSGRCWFRGLFRLGVMRDSEHVPVVDEGRDVGLLRSSILVGPGVFNDIDGVGDFLPEAQDVAFCQNGAAEFSFGP